ENCGKREVPMSAPAPATPEYTRGTIWMYSDMSSNSNPQQPRPVSRAPGMLFGSHDVVLRGNGVEVSTSVNFFYNHQLRTSIWLEAPPEVQKWPAGSDVEVVVKDVMLPFPASVRGIHL